MSFLSTEKLLSDAIITQLTTGWTGHAIYNTSNVFPVPRWIPPPIGFAKNMILVLNPVCTRTGAAGGSYLQNITVQIGVFIRTLEDARSHKIKAHEMLAEENDLVCKRLEGFSASGTLAVALYRDATPAAPMEFITEGGIEKGVLWCQNIFRGIRGRTTIEYQEDLPDDEEE